MAADGGKELLTQAEIELTKQVARLFKLHYPAGPLPNEAQSYSVAVMINIVRENKQYERNFKKGNVGLRQRRAVLMSTERLIQSQTQLYQSNLNTFAPLRLSGWVEALEDLEALKVALNRATPHLLAPFDPLAGERDNAWWHKAAIMIAQRARAALEAAGHTKVSYQKHGKFVVLAAAALKLAGIRCAPTTLATILSKANQ